MKLLMKRRTPRTKRKWLQKPPRQPLIQKIVVNKEKWQHLMFPLLLANKVELRIMMIIKRKTKSLNKAKRNDLLNITNLNLMVRLN